MEKKRKDFGTHIIVLGMSTTGKTSFARLLASAYQKQGLNIAVLEPVKTNWGKTAFHTTDTGLMLEFAKTNRDCKIFIDECSETLDRDRENNFFATRSRQFGHQVCFICQEFTMVLPAIRNNCSCIAAFRQSLDDSQKLAQKYVDDAFLQCRELQLGECIYKKTLFSQAKKLKIF